MIVFMRWRKVLNSDLLLALTHGQELEAVPPEARPLGQLHEVAGGVGAGAQDEHDGGVGAALLIDGIEADHRGLHVPGRTQKDQNNIYTCSNEVE